MLENNRYILSQKDIILKIIFVLYITIHDIYNIPGPAIAPNGDPIPPKPPNALMPPNAPKGENAPPPKGMDNASLTACCAAAAACTCAE